jgi:hypothetical protein
MIKGDLISRESVLVDNDGTDDLQDEDSGGEKWFESGVAQDGTVFWLMRRIITTQITRWTLNSCNIYDALNCIQGPMFIIDLRETMV